MSKVRILKAENVVCYVMPSFAREEDSEKDLSQKEDLYLGQNALEVEREAYESGYSAGERAGLEMGEQKAALLLRRLEDIIKEIENVKGSLIKEIESHVLDMAVEIARKIVLEEISTKPELMIKMTKEAMKKIERIGQITIKISPSLYELFIKHKPELLELHQDIVFDVDSSLSAAGTTVIGALDEVVTDVDEQLKNIDEDIRGNIGAP